MLPVAHEVPNRSKEMFAWLSQEAEVVKVGFLLY
jgi:hypothetical protein